MIGVPRRVFVLAGLLGAGLCTSAAQTAARTQDEVVAFVTRAVSHIRTVGPQAAFADFNRRNGGFIDGELYVFCNAADGAVLAHGGNPKFVGRNMIDVTDSQGIRPVAELTRIGLTLGRGWVDYFWPNPLTGRVERKTGYVVRIDDNTICGAGYFRSDPP